MNIPLKRLGVSYSFKSTHGRAIAKQLTLLILILTVPHYAAISSAKTLWLTSFHFEVVSPGVKPFCSENRFIVSFRSSPAVVFHAVLLCFTVRA
jgi:hypothetical protein